MNMNIYVLCYNEEVLIEQMILHYKKYLPNCKITIYDNESTDNSVQIAKSYNCNVISWNSNNEINDYKYLEIKNNCWKSLPDNEWVLLIDMDEWLCITEEELQYEDTNGTTILNIQGYNVVGESNDIELKDIDLHNLNKACKNAAESKKLCFKKGPIKEINYELGCHNSHPIGLLNYSKKIYINKHMEFLGLPYVINKYKNRHTRVGTNTPAIHYTNDANIVTHKYNCWYNNSEFI